MSKIGLFSVIIAHYNQLAMLPCAVQSVLCQDYPRIELIIADDASADFSEQSVRSGIAAQGTGVENIIILHGDKNVGTVASLNNAIAACHGDYLLMLAADDALEDGEVLAKLEQALQCRPEVAGVFARCMEYDAQLVNIVSEYYYPRDKSMELGALNASEQYARLAMGCLISIGATAFRRSALETRPLNEKYQFIEDWPLFLQLTRQGKRLAYLDIVALRHRAGGVSRQGSNTLSRPARICNIEFVRILEQEVLPYIGHMPRATQGCIITRYEDALADTLSRIGEFAHMERRQLYGMYPMLMLRRAVHRRISRLAAYAKGRR